MKQQPVQLGRGSFWIQAYGYFLDAASFAHCQDFSAAGLSRPFVPTMLTEIGFG